VASDILYNKFQNKHDQIGGYFSYANEGTFICVFVNRENTTKTSITMTFDSTFSNESVVIDTLSRNLTLLESELFEIRTETVKAIENGKEINSYQNTDFNIIPIINDDIKKVYILTATTQPRKVIFGNDYLLKFDKKNKLKDIEPLHKSLLSFEDTDSTAWVTHTHLPGFNPFMTATDVCTLLLYGEHSKTWHHHIVISEKYVSIWDYNAKRFVVMNAEVFFSNFENKKQ
jgi:hypothetical protein